MLGSEEPRLQVQQHATETQRVLGKVSETGPIKAPPTTARAESC